jgi:phage shock protein C
MIARPNLFARDDTFLGVCQGIGEDLRFNPDLLRLALAGMLFWNPLATAVTYAALGVVVLVTRLLFPTRRAMTTASPDTITPPVGNNDPAPALLAAAA